MTTRLTYRRSDGGTEKEEKCHREFRTLLTACAVVWMKRRGSNTLDESDFANAYRELLASRDIDWTRSLLGGATLLAGGGLISWGVGYFPAYQSWQDAAPGAFLSLLGLAFGFIGVFIQFWPHWRR